MSKVFELPDLGENIEQAEILNVLVSEGDDVEKDQAVLEVESDKATVEVPSGVAGKIDKLFVSAGDTIQVGDKVLSVSDEGGGDAEPKQAKGNGESRTKARRRAEDAKGKGEARAKSKDEPQKAAPEEGEPKAEARAAKAQREERRAEEEAREPDPEGDGRPVFASPSVRRVARERGVNIREVAGSGPQGRISIEDVERHARGDGRPAEEPEREAPAAAKAPATGERDRAEPRGAPDADEHGPVERVALSKTRRTISARLAEAWRTIPHVTLHAQPDVSALLDLVSEYREVAPSDVKVSITALLLKITAGALRRHPGVNASFDEEAGELVKKRYVNLGVAVDTERGLLVPVIRDADRKSVLEIARELRDLAARAREGKLSGADMKGASFTVTNLGGLGVKEFTPIINPPEIAVLGVGRTQAAGDGQRLPLSLSIDHRVLDGADGARFLQTLESMCQDRLRLAFEV